MVPQNPQSPRHRPSGPPGPPDATPAGAHARRHEGAVDLAADRLGALAHEIAGLVDGSLRQVSLASTRLARVDPARAADAAFDTGAATIADVQQRLATVRSALEHMARSVHGAMQRQVSRTLAAGSLADAVFAAARLLEPGALASGITLDVEVDSRTASLSALCAYGVIVGAVKNAVEAIQHRDASSRARLKAGGTIRVSARLRTGAGVPKVVLEITDDGPGLARGCDAARLLTPGVSTKPGHLGIGLSIMREIVLETGGAFELLSRDDAPAGATGVTLRAILPARARDDA
ncbi:hypothetical protein BH11PLA1_BH11PLA1_22400 [soil metagenome]